MVQVVLDGGVTMASKWVTCWDNAGIERRVRSVDAREIVAAGGSDTAPVAVEESVGKVTSPEVASLAAEILADEDSTPAEKSVAASALSQAAPKRGKKKDAE